MPVFWRPASTARPLPQDPGRWNVRGGQYAQYFSLTEDGAWAEFVRAREIHSAQMALGTVRRMWVVRVHETDIADLSTPENVRDCGIEPSVLVGPYLPCQEIAVELQRKGYRGILSPCAALDRTTNLTLWGPRIDAHLRAGEPFSPTGDDPEIIEVRILRSASPPPGDFVDRARHYTAAPGTYVWESADHGTTRDLLSPDLD